MDTLLSRQRLDGFCQFDSRCFDDGFLSVDVGLRHRRRWYERLIGIQERGEVVITLKIEINKKLIYGINAYCRDPSSSLHWIILLYF